MRATAYEHAGVGGQSNALAAVVRHLQPSFAHLEGAEVITRFGHPASAIKVAPDLAIALCTDGVGSKTMIASALDRYDTIGIDCVAMNVNDMICLGARPLAMVDYLGVNALDPRRTDELLRGLGAGAKQAGIAIPGGELAQLPEIIGSSGAGAADESAFDLVGACVGTVHPDRVILGHDIRPGDALIGIASSGIHSNGLTLARKVLLESGAYALPDHVDGLGRTLGEELLEPTEIYVAAIDALRSASIEIRGLSHITGDGFANLARLEAQVGYAIEQLPPRPEIFALIQEQGSLDDAEMFRVFNMGVGFIVIVAPEDADGAVTAIGSGGYSGRQLGAVTGETGTVRIEPHGLIGGLSGGDSRFFRTTS
jgi:phosphoribosylformylglycinamidine cyclo-ligase